MDSLIKTGFGSNYRKEKQIKEEQEINKFNKIVNYIVIAILALLVIFSFIVFDNIVSNYLDQLNGAPIIF